MNRECQDCGHYEYDHELSRNTRYQCQYIIEGDGDEYEDEQCSCELFISPTPPGRKPASIKNVLNYVPDKTLQDSI